jgi:phosphoglycolate phosphatase-like HAD superfamily hydrolase
MKLVLFDIDGTLLWTDGAGRRAIHRALLDQHGTAGPIDDYRFDGKTDPQIVRELLTHAGVPEAAISAGLDAVFERYLILLEGELARDRGATRLLAGVHDLLHALQSPEADGHVLVGLLTGNLETGAALKLRSAGLDPARFALGAYGSDAERRDELPPVALRRAAERVGPPIRAADVVIVGDTPADVACGRPIGASSVAVATGYYDVDELRAAGATHVFPDLADTRAVLAALHT